MEASIPMTDTMSARQRIRAVLEEAARVPSEMKLHGDEHVDRIIDIVREALTSDAAIEAMSEKMYRNLHPANSYIPTWEQLQLKKSYDPTYQDVLAVGLHYLEFAASMVVGEPDVTVGDQKS